MPISNRAGELASAIGTNGRRDCRRHVGAENGTRRKRAGREADGEKSTSGDQRPGGEECEADKAELDAADPPPTDAPARKDAPRVAHEFAYFITRY